jgi:hypothetical protein
MQFKSTYGLGDIVYLKTDPDQFERIVTEVAFKGDGGIIYNLNLGASQSCHYDIELSSKKDLMKQLDISDKNQSI